MVDRSLTSAIERHILLVSVCSYVMTMHSAVGDDVDRTDFDSIQRFCREHFPDALSNNVDVLKFTRWDRADTGGAVPRWKRWILSYFFLEYYSLKAARYRSSSPSELGTFDLVVPFTNTCRDEYQPFFYTVIDEMEMELDVAIFTSRNRCVDGFDADLFDSVDIIYEEDLVSFRIYAAANRRYAALKEDIEDLCDAVGLTAIERYNTHRFFEKYCYDAEIFERLLTAAEPRLLYAVQYNSNRGYLKAIEAYERERNLTSVVVQHGAFRENYYHPFAGADHAILWGEHFKELLETIDTPPQPDNVHLLGNPNLEYKRAQVEATWSTNVDSPTVLYASTGSPFGEKALTMFAEVAASFDDIRVRYKPHPHGEAAKYDPLVERGLITDAQLRPDGDIYELVAAADVVFGTQTSVLPEALVFDTPAIQVLPDDSTEAWREYGLRSVSTAAELESELERLLTEDKYVQHLLDAERELERKLFGEVDGSAQRIAALLESLAKQ